MTVKRNFAVIIAVCAVLFAGVTAEAEDYADLVERVMPSIVLIKTDKGTGSGFFVSSEGDVLTNYHVVDGARYITVTLQNGSSLQASLKSYNAKKDMALLALNVSSSVKFLKISAKLPRHGEGQNLNFAIAPAILAEFVKEAGNGNVYLLARNGTPEQLKAARKRGANFNVSRSFSDGDDTEILDEGETPLHIAAMYNRNAGSIKFLISQGLDVNALATSGNAMFETPLSLALRNKNIIAVKELLRAGANPHSYANNGNYFMGGAFHIVASEYKNYSEAKAVIDMLLKAGGDVNNHDKFTPKYTKEFIRYNLSEFDFHRRDWASFDQWGGLMSYFSHVSLHEFMSSCTPLMYAVLNDNPDVVNILLDAKADPNIRNLEGKTALDYAMLMPDWTNLKRSEAFKRLKTLTARKTSRR